MPKRPWTDAKFEVVRGPRPKRWAPLAGLGPVQQIAAVSFMFAGLALLHWLIERPAGRLADWLLSLAGVGGGHT